MRIEQIYAHLGIHHIYVGEAQVQEMTSILSHKEEISRQYSNIQEKEQVQIHTRGRKQHEVPKDTKAVTRTMGSEQKVIDIEQFDIRFKTVCKTMKRTPCVWTYYLLGEDMFGTPSVKRRQWIKDLLTALHMPQGTYSFLPFTAPDKEGVLQVHSQEFISILHIYKPSLVLFFGNDALSHILPSYNGRIWQECMLFPPIRGMLLPAIESIDKERDAIVRYLREYMKSIGLVK